MKTQVDLSSIHLTEGEDNKAIFTTFHTMYTFYLYRKFFGKLDNIDDSGQVTQVLLQT